MTDSYMTSLLTALNNSIAEREKWVAQDDPDGIFYDEDLKGLNKVKALRDAVLAYMED